MAIENWKKSLVEILLLNGFGLYQIKCAGCNSALLKIMLIFSEVMFNKKSSPVVSINYRAALFIYLLC